MFTPAEKQAFRYFIYTQWQQRRERPVRLFKQIEAWIHENLGDEASHNLVYNELLRSLAWGDLPAANGVRLALIRRSGCGEPFYEPKREIARRSFPGFPFLPKWKPGCTLTVPEACMMQCMELFTTRPNWYEKLDDEEFMGEWKRKLVDRDRAQRNGEFTERMIEWCITELEEKASLYKVTGIVPTLDYAMPVLKSDGLADLARHLRAASRPLENVPEAEWDWSPGSNGTVRNLVSPYICPLVYGRSKVVREERVTLQTCLGKLGQGTVLGTSNDEDTESDYDVDWFEDTDEFREISRMCKFWEASDEDSDGSHNQNDSDEADDSDSSSDGSESSSGSSDNALLGGPDLWKTLYQQLPCEVDISHKARIESYINNLHPTTHEDLYREIERVIDQVLPMWDILYRWDSEFKRHRVPHCSRPSMYCTTPHICKGKGKLRGGCRPDCRPLEEGETRTRVQSWWNYWTTPEGRADTKWFEETHGLVVPEPLEVYEPYPLRPRLVKPPGQYFNNADRIQVIVEMTSVHLTPDKANFLGELPHVEGHISERICATARFYYDDENVTHSGTVFHSHAFENVNMCDELRRLLPLRFRFNEHWRPSRVHDIHRPESYQTVGQVLSCPDRLMVFPNVFHNYALPFGLQDKSKPGHSKILTLHLVDPTLPILSTANVPPQQGEWWVQEWLQGTRLGLLPPEILDHIFSYVRGYGPFMMEEAREVRDAVYEERAKYKGAFDAWARSKFTPP